MKKNNCIIAGGGICGLFSAILLTDYFENVYIIEKESECGGLLKSIKLPNGAIFDQGTHVPNTTLIPEIDNILFGKEEERHLYWNDLGKLRSGNYFNGRWNLINQMLDVRNLPDDIYQKGIIELLSLTKLSQAENIVSFLCETLGPTFTQHAIAPIAQKLYGNEVELSKLVTNSSVSYFGLSRVMALDSIVSKKLKELPAFDEKLAYHNEKDFEQRLRKDKVPQRKNYYPKNNQGVGFWVAHLLKQAKDKGVKFFTNDYIDKINHENKKVTSIELGNCKEKIRCDYLFWTAPPVLALEAAGIKVLQTDVTFRSACIFHYQIDRQLLNTESHYVWNWDSKYKGFRITLYSNMQKDIISNTAKLTVETLCKPDEVDCITLEEMFNELVSIGLVDKSSLILSQKKQIIHHTFPIPTFEFVDAVASHYEQLSGAFKNIHIAGRFAGKNWFHEDVFKGVYFDLKEKFGSTS
ncbi:NAD(P)-binding protein [Pseudoalteromonas denitrificans]|uniref:NAD(P)-binding Rossmann-like domain-containing protein n=1 Tax=Pseudoalteromonas denitrificans DSM 6059 TaxID=1123010 RepID=A0A1I1HT36_9GAMM|nr:NAD(P)-binding protein [Pseudoalteromonas denitrificans]SFC24613.1 NAD(P)-binding Rossmann-like domain-containing protein [Pseudoalteromonas denitrificans DSM 6059]